MGCQLDQAIVCSAERAFPLQPALVEDQREDCLPPNAVSRLHAEHPAEIAMHDSVPPDCKPSLQLSAAVGSLQDQCAERFDSKLHIDAWSENGAHIYHFMRSIRSSLRSA